MRKPASLLFIIYSLLATCGYAQFNTGFEEYKYGTDTLRDWNVANGQLRAGGTFMIDRAVKHGGSQSLHITRAAIDSVYKFTTGFVELPVDFEARFLGLSCWMKTANVKGRAQFYIVITNAVGDLLYQSNLPNNDLNGTTGWQQYTTTVAVPDDAYKISVGVLLVGTGDLWVDDFDLRLDFQSYNERKKIKKLIAPALYDNKEFKNVSGISTLIPTHQQEEDLYLLGKTWGFLKYYHPYISQGNLNWDYELFRFLPAYLKNSSKDDRNKLLLQWINKWEKPRACKSCSDKTPGNAVQLPDLAWINDEQQLGADLSQTLRYIRDNRHQGNSYYVKLAPNIGNPVISHENPYAQFNYPDAGYRLLALFRYWNVIQYWFPYKHLIGEDWNNVLKEFISPVLAAENSTRYAQVMRQLIARIHDTHANISGYHAGLDSLKGKLYPDVKVRFVNELPVISAIPNPGLQPELEIGDVITAINGKDVGDIIKEELVNLPASNYSTQLRDFAAYILRGNDSVAQLMIDRNGRKMNVQLKRYSPQSRMIARYVFDFPYQKDSSFFFIAPGIGYINLGKIRKLQVDSVFDALQGSKGLIIDNRQYPGDFPIYHISAKLLPDRQVFANVLIASLDYPGMFVKRSSIETGTRKNKKFYDRPVVILVNENTQSSAEFHSMAFRIAPKATVIGSTTAGADGDVSGFFLPGSLYTMFSGINILQPDNKETQRAGIIPDIIVTPTITGIRERRDELVERAIDIILKKP